MPPDFLAHAPDCHFMLVWLSPQTILVLGQTLIPASPTKVVWSLDAIQGFPARDHFGAKTTPKKMVPKRAHGQQNQLCWRTSSPPARWWESQESQPSCPNTDQNTYWNYRQPGVQWPVQLPDDRFGKQTVLQIVLCRTFWNHLFLCNEIGIFLDGTLKFHVVCLRPNRWPLVLKDVPRTAGDRKDSWSKKCFHRSTLQTAFNAGNNPKSAIWRIYECELWSVWILFCPLLNGGSQQYAGAQTAWVHACQPSVSNKGFDPNACDGDFAGLCCNSSDAKLRFSY